MAVRHYLHHLSIYTGKSQDTGKPFGSSVVNATVDIVEKTSTLSIHSLYFDNFFLPVISYWWICQLEMSKL